MKSRSDRLVIFIIYFGFFAAIEFLVTKDIVSSAILPKPSEILKLFWLDRSVLTTAFLQTAFSSVVAFILAAFLAFALGILIHLSDLLKKTAMPVALFLQTVPIIAIAPLLVIYFGFGWVTTLIAGIIVCFFPVLISTTTGLANTKSTEDELLQFLKASRLQKLIFLQIPNALPNILAGLKTSAGLAVIGVVSGEFLVGSGLGALIESSRLQQRVDFVFASLILLALLGLILMKSTEIIFTWLFKKYLIRK